MTRHYHRERQFGWVVGFVLAALGARVIWRGAPSPIGQMLLVSGLLLLALAFVSPRSLAYPRRAWMALAEALSFVSTRVILGVVFLLVMTPIGVVRRLQGHDPLGRRGFGLVSHWLPYPERVRDAKHFEKTF